jgi:hypothetical protein
MQSVTVVAHRIELIERKVKIPVLYTSPYVLVDSVDRVLVQQDLWNHLNALLG